MVVQAHRPRPGARARSINVAPPGTDPGGRRVRRWVYAPEMDSVSRAFSLGRASYGMNASTSSRLSSSISWMGWTSPDQAPA
jgi:hypothetical protein